MSFRTYGSSTTKEEASKLIAEKIAEIELSFKEIQAIADENGISFYWSGPTYGMGGSYTSKIERQRDKDDEYYEDDGEESETGGMWRNSNC